MTSASPPAPTARAPGAPPVPAPYDGGRRWSLAGQVALRPEPFGALAYHFGTRRLSFLKSRTLLEVVASLAFHESGDAACAAAGVPEGELPVYRGALARLAESGMIEPRGQR